jgi:hypothetical protein
MRAPPICERLLFAQAWVMRFGIALPLLRGRHAILIELPFAGEGAFCGNG